MTQAGMKQGIASFQTDQTEMSSPCIDIFTPPIVETNLISGHDIEISPITAVNNDGPYEFQIRSSNDEYLYMPQTRLKTVFKIKKVGSNGAETTPTNADDYSVINLLGNTLYKQLEVYCNEVLVTDLYTPTYGYKAYMETLLSYGKEAKTSHLKSALFYNCYSNHIRSNRLCNGSNKSYKVDCTACLS